MAFIIRVMCQDAHPELVEAWSAILEAGQPPEALAILHALDPVSYEQASGPIKRALSARNKVEEIELARRLGDHFREQYRRATEVARGKLSPQADRR